MNAWEILLRLHQRIRTERKSVSPVLSEHARGWDDALLWVTEQLHELVAENPNPPVTTERAHPI